MDLSFLSKDLRRYDYDRYLFSLFAPAEVRAPLQALFLFNHEISRTRSMVTDTNLGLIRLQWWRDELAKIYSGQGGGNIPILSTMADIIHQQALPQDLFDTLIYAHEFDLEDRQPPAMDGLINYADFTTTPLNKLALKMMTQEAEEDEIRRISVNYGLLSLIRSVPFMLKEGRCYLPENLLKIQNLSLKNTNDLNEIQSAVQSVCDSIEPYRYSKLRFLRIQQKFIHIYLNRIAKLDYNVFHPAMSVPPAFFALRLAL